MDRIAMRDYKLSDGTVIPKGTYILVPSSASNFDTDIWGPDAHNFDPWRFQKLRLEPGQETAHSFVQTAPKFTYFGYVPLKTFKKRIDPSLVVMESMRALADSSQQMRSKSCLPTHLWFTTLGFHRVNRSRS
jgi:hypothetical protein